MTDKPEFACFVTGTDTGAGKTWISLALLSALALRGRRVAGMKPVASGTGAGGDLAHNEDALLLQAHCTAAVPYQDVNPYLFTDPIAPHVAAAKAGTRVKLAPIREAYARLCTQAEAVVVEGIGGWRVPLAPDLQTADLVRALELPVILVVGLRLGCINHCLLSVESILRDGMRLAGWVANHVDPEYAEPQATVNYLRTQIRAPLIGRVPWQERLDPEALAAYLDLAVLPDA